MKIPQLLPTVKFGIFSEFSHSSACRAQSLGTLFVKISSTAEKLLLRACFH
jgi:hypothetical protein